MDGCSQDCLILIPFRLPQISCFTLSLKCFSSDSNSCPNVGIRPLLQFPHPPRAGPVLLTLLFSPRVPLSYGVLPGVIYSFLLARYSFLLSAGVLHAFLCLKYILHVSMEKDVLHVHYSSTFLFSRRSYITFNNYFIHSKLWESLFNQLWIYFCSMSSN